MAYFIERKTMYWPRKLKQRDDVMNNNKNSQNHVLRAVLKFEI